MLFCQGWLCLCLQLSSRRACAQAVSDSLFPCLGKAMTVYSEPWYISRVLGQWSSMSSLLSFGAALGAPKGQLLGLTAIPLGNTPPLGIPLP